MRVQQITHVALDLVSPTNMEHYLRKAFGLQTLRAGFWKGDYVRIVGAPGRQTANPGFLALHFRPGIPEGRVNHIAFGVRDLDVPTAIEQLRREGAYVDDAGDDMVYGPEGLHVQIDSLTHPRSIPKDDPTVAMVDLPVDPDLPCLVRGIHHISLELAVPTRMEDWMRRLFEIDGTRQFYRKGEFIRVPFYADEPPDSKGRRPAFTPLYQRRPLTKVRINHISFDVADTYEAMTDLARRGIWVDQANDAEIYGPENVWFEIDSYDVPIPWGHPANDAGVPVPEF
jgi:hypothetical protein